MVDKTSEKDWIMQRWDCILEEAVVMKVRCGLPLALAITQFGESHGKKVGQFQQC